MHEHVVPWNVSVPIVYKICISFCSFLLLLVVFFFSVAVLSSSFLQLQFDSLVAHRWVCK